MTTFGVVVLVEEVVGIDGEDLIFSIVDMLEPITVNYFSRKHSVILLHFLDILTWDVAEEAETANHLIESKYEIVVDYIS